MKRFALAGLVAGLLLGLVTKLVKMGTLLGNPQGPSTMLVIFMIATGAMAVSFARTSTKPMAFFTGVCLGALFTIFI